MPAKLAEQVPRRAQPSHYVFPREKYGLKGEDGYKTGAVATYDIDPTKPIGSWKVAWTTAREVAKVECRWHDSRHSFISTLAEGQASDTTIIGAGGACLEEDDGAVQPYPK